MYRRLIDGFGWYGMIAILVAYVLVTFEAVPTDGFVYQFLNLTGAAGLAGVSLRRKAYQPAILNITWAAIALVALVNIWIN